MYTVNLDGTAPTRVDDSAVTSIYDVENMRLLDGASRLVYGTRDFYSVNLDGSGHATLSSGFVTQFEFTPDETKFVYQNNNLTPPRRLYSVDIDGTNSTELNTALVFGQNISDFAISEDGSKVVYYGDQEVEDEFNVYSVNVDGTGGVKLNGSIVSGGFGVGFRNFSEANNIVYYLSDEETSGLGELFKVDIDGNNRTKVPGALGIASITYNLFGCMVMGASGDGNQAIHCADPDGDGIHNLYTTNGDGSGYALASPLFAAGGSMYNDFEMSGDKNYVLSKVDVNGDGVDRLYISPVDGSGVEEFSVELGASEHVYKYKIDGQRVTYITYENGRMEIYQRTIGSQTTYKLSGSSPAGTSIGADFKTFENGKYVVYSSNRENPLQSTVYVAEVP